MDEVLKCISKILLHRHIFPEKCFDRKSGMLRKGSYPSADILLEKLNVVVQSESKIHSFSLIFLRDQSFKEVWNFYLKNETKMDSNWDCNLQDMGFLNVNNVLLQVHYLMEIGEKQPMNGFSDCNINAPGEDEPVGVTTNGVMVSVWQENENAESRTDCSYSTADCSSVFASNSQNVVAVDSQSKFDCICGKPSETDSRNMVIFI
eukprot:NODE_95_length_21511_cov_0.501168.p11 type:complete len:205 gc:universal NODE_95_length_21511_cov_0.501168:19353-19967(+)